MTIDLHAYLGPFAFRRLRPTTAAGLVALMDRHRIDRAVVASAAALTYRNPQPANEDLAEEARAHRDRLTPFAVLNPAYAGWRDDLEACHRGLGMAGVRLYPRWHHYQLTDPECLALVDAATARGLPIAIPVRVEDPRQRSWLVDIPDVPLTEIAALIAARPAARFAVLNGLRVVDSPLGKPDAGLPANYLVDFARMDAVLANEIGALVANLGPDRLVFGTGMPFQEPAAAVLKLDLLKADLDQKDQIARRNAERWLGLTD